MIGVNSPQQAAVYGAQDSARGRIKQLHCYNEEQVVAYAQAVYLSRQWTELMPPGAPTQVDVKVVNDRKLDNCASFRHEVPVVQFNLAHGVDDLTVLHELAHVAAGPNQGHREMFLFCFLRLVYVFLGTEAWQALREELIKREAAMP